MIGRESQVATGLTEGWDELATRLDAPPFMRPRWFSIYADAFEAGQIDAVTVERDGQLAALIPLERARRGLRSPANWHSPAFGPLAVDSAAHDELLEKLFRLPDTSIELNQLVEANGPASAVSAAARSGRRLVVERETAQAPYISLEGDFDGYEAGLSRNRRRSLRRQWKRLNSLGSVDMEVHRGGDELDGLLDELFAVEASGWKGEQGTAISSTPETNRFYRELAAWAADHGWLRLAFLRLDGRAIACDYALAHGRCWYSLKAGYADDLRDLGPGASLLREEIRHCYSEGMERIDLLGDADAFKASWTAQRSPRTWMRALRRTPAGAATWASLSLMELARPYARRAMAALR
jgi:CelD/BcsL family acetyltransferase involved in cellulose biosynthesis